MWHFLKIRKGSGSSPKAHRADPKPQPSTLKTVVNGSFQKQAEWICLAEEATSVVMRQASVCIATVPWNQRFEVQLLK